MNLWRKSADLPVKCAVSRIPTLSDSNVAKVDRLFALTVVVFAKNVAKFFHPKIYLSVKLQEKPTALSIHQNVANVETILESMQRIISKTSKKIYCQRHVVKCSDCNFYIGIGEHFVSKTSGRVFCSDHAARCDKCGDYVGIDESTICVATGGRYCSCTKFKKCIVCEQSYSASSIVDGKCPACNTLLIAYKCKDVLTVIKYDPSRSKTKNWLIGRNALNTVVIAKGSFSDNLYVIVEDEVVHKKTIPFIQKLGK